MITYELAFDNVSLACKIVKGENRVAKTIFGPMISFVTKIVTSV